MSIRFWETALKCGRKIFTKTRATNPIEAGRVIPETAKTVGDEAILGGKLVSHTTEIPQREIFKQKLLSFCSKKDRAEIESLLTPEMLEVLEDQAKIFEELSPLQKLVMFFFKKHFTESLKRNLTNFKERLSFVNRTEIYRNLPSKTKMQIGSAEALLFANGNKPAVSMGFLRVPNLVHPKIDIINDEYGSTLLNKAQVKELIERHKPIYCNRFGCSPETSVEEIYAKLKKLLEKAPVGSEDIFGITMGYPRKNTMIHQLQMFANKKYGTDFCCGELECAPAETIELYKSILRKALKEKDSPYANASQDLIKEIEEAIDKIKEVKGSQEVLKGQRRFLPGFVIYTPEPDEISRINSNIAHLEEAIASGKTLRF